MKIKWWHTSRTKQNTTLKHKNFTIFSLILREIDAEKTNFQPAKTQKMTNLFMNLEFKILRLLMKIKRWLTSRTTQTRLRNIKISPFSDRISSEKSKLRRRYFSQRKCRKWPFFHDVGIKNFEVIYEEQVMAHILNHTKHEFETKISPFSRLSSEKSMMIKHVFRPKKTQKMTNYSWHWNSKFWGYLCITSDGLHSESNKTRLRNIKILPFSLLSSEKSMLRKRDFSQRKRRKWPLF
jgi:hypothetical protein